MASGKVRGEGTGDKEVYGCTPSHVVFTGQWDSCEETNGAKRIWRKHLSSVLEFALSVEFLGVRKVAAAWGWHLKRGLAMTEITDYVQSSDPQTHLTMKIFI